MPSVNLTASRTSRSLIHLLFDSSADPALLPGVDDSDDKDTSIAGVHNKDTSITGVPVPNTTITANADDDPDTESNHISIDPNEDNDNSSKASIHSTRGHISDTLLSMV